MTVLKYVNIPAVILVMLGPVFAQQSEIPLAETISGFPCSACHISEDWSIIRMSAFDHDSTAFPLIGAHKKIACASCHSGKNIKEKHLFGNAATDCGSCHIDLHETLLGTSCKDCHVTTSWQDAGTLFDHQQTLFPLEGNHIGLSCESCHFDYSAANLSGLVPDCENCHRAAKARAETQSPDHALFPSSCQKCHVVFSWTEITFDHALTNFPLTGAHTATDCALCHESGYSGTTQRCDVCHIDRYYNTSAPDHSTQIYLATDCELCHDTETFETSIYLHNPAPAVCSLCHLTNLTTANQTITGHDGLPNDCSTCHTTTDWTILTFDHAVSGFPLEGVHLTATCESCHADGFLNTPSECLDCHMDAYDQTTQPPHAESGFQPENCDICHTATDWTTLTFDHAVAGFPLEGIHLTATCESCHADGFLNTPSECLACHMDAYDQTTQPPHAEFGFQPENCDICHTALGWTPASFDHNNITTGCTDCHSYEGGWDPLPVIDHNSSPKLGSSIEDCVLCHSNTSNWQTISFQNNRHDGNTYDIYFNIYSGKHSGEWGSSCSDNCHVFGTFDSFSCYDNCHTNKHSRSRMLDKHCEGGGSCSSCFGTNGYWSVSLQYSDGDWGIPQSFNQCYSCHPDGNNGGACGEGGDRIRPNIKFRPEKKIEIKGSIK